MINMLETFKVSFHETNSFDPIYLSQKYLIFTLET